MFRKVIEHFSKFANLQCSDCNSTINRLCHRYFVENLQKTSYFIGSKFRKVYAVREY